MSKSTAASFLVKLSTDPVLRSRFQASPTSVLDEAGIFGEDRDILMSGNPDKVRSHFAGNDTPPGCLVLYDPGDDDIKDI